MKKEFALRIGTRGSRLALAQAAIVAGLVSRSTSGIRVEVVPIRTAGDVSQKAGAADADLKLAFTHGIDRRLLEGKIDVAVHSLKDVPSSIDGRLTIASTPPRADARDALVTVSGGRLAELPAGSGVGTSSIRRRVQLSKLRHGLRVVDIRGNVETRIEKMEERGLAGVVLAAAGLQRLGLAGRASQYFTPDEMVPAACQGVIAAVARLDDERVLDVLKKIDDHRTHLESLCERAFLRRIGGDCNFPVGAYASVSGGKMRVVGMVADQDGSSMRKGSGSGDSSEPERLGAVLAEKLLKREGGSA